MTPAQLRLNRTAAGLAYVKAAAEFRAALLELHAHDLALTNTNVIEKTRKAEDAAQAAWTTTRDGEAPKRVAHFEGRFLLFDARIPSHSTFAVEGFHSQHLSAEALARAEELMKQIEY